MPLTYLIMFFGSLLFLLKAICDCWHRQPFKLPPGPKPWPLIGNLHLIGALPHCSIRSLSGRYGPLMQLWFGCRPVIVAGSVEMAKEVLHTHDLSLIDRPLSAGGKYLAYNNGSIAYSPYGPYWRQARKIISTKILCPKKLQSLESVRLRGEEVRELVKKLFKDSGKQVRVKDHISIMSLNIISRMAFGKAYTEGSINTLEEFRRNIEEYFILLGVFNIGDYMPWLKFLDVQGYERRMKKLGKDMDHCLERVLNDHVNRQQRHQGEVSDDIVDVFLRLDGDPHLQVKLNRDNIKAILLDILAAGTDTTTVTIEWILSELIRNKKTLIRATNEVEKMIGRDKWAEEEDIASGGFPYLESVIKESMRLHPLTPLLVPRLAREDCTINNYHVPTGTTVLVNIWSIGRDPNVWEMPEEFQPERFMGKEIDVKGKHFELLPFGSGRRMCPGYNQGLKVVKLTIANLLQGFDWKLPDDIDLSMEEAFGLVLNKKVPLEVIVTPRHPSHMYI